MPGPATRRVHALFLFLVTAVMLACFARCSGGTFSVTGADGIGEDLDVMGDGTDTPGDDSTSSGEDPGPSEPDGVDPDGIEPDIVDAAEDGPGEDVFEDSAPTCGDGACNGAETCEDCPADCECPPPPAQKQVFFTLSCRPLAFISNPFSY